MALVMSAAMARMDGRCGFPSFVDRGWRNHPRSMPPCSQTNELLRPLEFKLQPRHPRLRILQSLPSLLSRVSNNYDIVTQCLRSHMSQPKAFQFACCGALRFRLVQQRAVAGPTCWQKYFNNDNEAPAPNQHQTKRGSPVSEAASMPVSQTCVAANAGKSRQHVMAMTWPLLQEHSLLASGIWAETETRLLLCGLVPVPADTSGLRKCLASRI